MSNAKVYVVTVNQVYQWEEMAVNYPKAFNTIDKAKAEFRKFVDDDRRYCERDGWKIEDDTDTHFLSYEDGDYVCNHTEVSIVELEVN